jgi:hypothetical protein
MRPSGPTVPVDGSPAFPPCCPACFVVADEAASRDPYQSHDRDNKITRGRHRSSRSGGACTGDYVRFQFHLYSSPICIMCRWEGRILIDSGMTAGILTRERSRIAYSFPKVRPHAPDTVQTPSRLGLSAWRRFKLSLWAFGARLQDHDIKYAVKTGAATAMLAAPAFFEATRPKFMEYRGEWALISVSCDCPPAVPQL